MAIISPLPYNIADGQAVDATPVMADLNQIVGNVNANGVGNSQSNTYTSGTTQNFTSATTLVSGAASGTAQPVPRSQADTLYLTATGPAFSAYATTGTALPAASAAKIALQAKEFDTANAFDATTNYRFQPQVAGYYSFTGAIRVDVGGTTILNVYLYKNGALLKAGTLFNISSSSQTSSLVQALIYMNGSTDYVELWGFINVASTSSVGIPYTYLCGNFVRPT